MLNFTAFEASFNSSQQKIPHLCTFLDFHRLGNNGVEGGPAVGSRQRAGGSCSNVGHCSYPWIWGITPKTPTNGAGLVTVPSLKNCPFPHSLFEKRVKKAERAKPKTTELRIRNKYCLFQEYSILSLLFLKSIKRISMVPLPMCTHCRTHPIPNFCMIPRQDTTFCEIQGIQWPKMLLGSPKANRQLSHLLKNQKSKQMLHEKC